MDFYINVFDVYECFAHVVENNWVYVLVSKSKRDTSCIFKGTKRYHEDSCKKIDYGNVMEDLYRSSRFIIIKMTK